MFVSLYDMIAQRTLWPYHSILEGITYIVVDFVAIASTYVINFLIVFRWKKQWTRKNKVFVDILLSFGMLFITNIPLLYGLSFLVPYDYYIDWAGAITYNLFILMGMEITFYVHRHIQQIEEINAAKQSALAFQNESLRKQINPHFLFNTLNIIYSLVKKDADKTQQAILMLTHIYRYTLEQATAHLISLSEELAFATDYTQLLLMRYDKALEIHFQVPEEIAHSYQVVPMTLQLLIENAVKHNKLTLQNPLRIEVTIKDKMMVVSNVVQPKGNIESTRIGLRYLQQVYAAQGRTITIEENEHSFCIGIPLLVTTYAGSTHAEDDTKLITRSLL